MNTQTFNTKYGFITCFSNDTVFYESMKRGNIYEEELILNNIINKTPSCVSRFFAILLFHTY